LRSLLSNEKRRQKSNQYDLQRRTAHSSLSGTDDNKLVGDRQLIIGPKIVPVNARMKIFDGR
jgi:hypothetical protein